MKRSKKTFIGMTFLALALAAISTFVLMGRHSVSAAVQSMNMPVNIFTMTTNGTLYVLTPNSSAFRSLGRPVGIGGDDPISMDFRPLDGRLYMLTDRGRLFTVNFNVSPPTATLVSNLSPRFPSGFQSLMDFNPQVDAIRLIGSGDRLNYAVVKNAAGILATTAVQTPLTYAAGDVNAGKNPFVAAGAYTNNVANAANTIFYAIDYDQDTLVTIANIVNGSSATGGGVLKTLGPLTDINGNPININSAASIDVVTNPVTGANFLIGIDRSNIAFQLNLSQVDPNQPLGTTQNVAVQGFNIPSIPNHDGSFMEIAASIPQGGW
jgi:Domain of unknown function (DUF4394)